MTGFQSRIRDAINQAAPAYGTVSVADRGLLHFLDASMSGPTRFMQKAGSPFALLTPQMSADLINDATPGAGSALIKGARLLPWLITGMTVSLELTEDLVVESVQETDTDGEVLVVFTTSVLSNHVAGTKLQIRGFPIVPLEDTDEGAGAPGSGLVSFLSPFILVAGDTLKIDGKKYTVASATEVSSDTTGRTYEIKIVGLDGLPALTTASSVLVLAKPAYRSLLLSLPQGDTRSFVHGPVAIDVVSGPMVTEYKPDPESEIYLEEFDSSGAPTADTFKIQKNDTISRIAITRDQMLFWRVAEGSVNWNGTFMELRAFTSGRAHLWTPCRPPLDAAPLTTKAATVPLFSPYAVLLLSRIVSGSLTVVEAATKAEIPSTDYSLNETTGALSFDSAWAGQAVIVTYRPRMEWQLFTRPSVDDIELTVVVGREAKQVFTLGAANTPTILTIKAETSEEVDQLHITARRSDDGGGAFTVELGDWQPRGPLTAVVRYTITTGAEVDYDWAASGLLIKPLWPTLELLKARLDGDGHFARYLDNGRILT